VLFRSMIVFLGQVHRKFRGREGFQEVDLDHYFQSIAKWAVEVNDPERMPEIVQRAFQVAQSGRPGPVVISLPEDVLPIEAEMHFGPPVRKPKPSPSSAEDQDAEKLLRTAQSPLIIARGGENTSQAEDRPLQFAELFGSPVMAAFRRPHIIPNDHALYAAHLGPGTNKNGLQTATEAEVLKALCTRLSAVTRKD